MHLPSPTLASLQTEMSKELEITADLGAQRAREMDCAKDLRFAVSLPPPPPSSLILYR